MRLASEAFPELFGTLDLVRVGLGELAFFGQLALFRVGFFRGGCLWVVSPEQ